MAKRSWEHLTDAEIQWQDLQYDREALRMQAVLDDPRAPRKQKREAKRFLAFYKEWKGILVSYEKFKDLPRVIEEAVA